MCATRGGGRSEAGHCFHLLSFWSRRACVRHTWWRTKRSWPLFLFQAYLRAPHVVAYEAKLAIVFTYLFSPTFRAIFRDGQRSVAEPGPTPSPWSITYFFLLLLSFFSFFSAFYFSPTSGNLPCVKICFPQYFGITRRYMQKKYFF